MIQEIFVGDNLIPGSSRDVVELIGMLSDETVAATVEFHGLKSISRKDFTGNVSLAKAQHERVAAET